MKKRKLKGYVLPSIYIITITILAIGITFMTQNLLENNQEQTEDKMDYATSVFNQEQTNDVATDTPVSEKVSKPFVAENVSIQKNFYKEEDTPENQENSLIYYENTYMKNTGILYVSDEVFDIYATIDGTIKEIKKDEILGTVVTLEGINGVTCIYYTLGDVNVKEKDVVKQNDIIAKSGQSQIETTKQTLLFEVYLNGTLTDPNIFYEKTLADLN